jgi:OHCU decarboxylase
MDLTWLNRLRPTEATAEFLKCCGSEVWARKMTESRPFENLEQLTVRAGEIWWTLDRNDWLEAFRSHPKIGEKKATESVSQQSLAWSGKEQSGVKDASQQVLSELALLNEQYDERFGFIFIVCATGKTSDEMLAILRSRLGNNAETEIRIAASEQERITEIRLAKLVSGQ